jgi:hypothetical protein
VPEGARGPGFQALRSRGPAPSSGTFQNRLVFTPVHANARPAPGSYGEAREAECKASSDCASNGESYRSSRAFQFFEMRPVTTRRLVSSDRDPGHPLDERRVSADASYRIFVRWARSTSVYLRHVRKTSTSGRCSGLRSRLPPGWMSKVGTPGAAGGSGDQYTRKAHPTPQTHGLWPEMINRKPGRDRSGAWGSGEARSTAQTRAMPEEGRDLSSRQTHICGEEPGDWATAIRQQSGGRARPSS